VASAPAVDPGPVEEVGWVTGEDSPNRTGSRFALHATDLGICWDDGGGGLLVAFGDSYGHGWGGHGPGPKDADWRCNLLARAALGTPIGTLDLKSVIEDVPGHAAQVLPHDPLVPEETVLPTSGIAVAGTQYMHYMSVRSWHGPGRWRTNYGAIAYSTDNAETWRTDGPRWPNRPARLWRGGGAAFQLGSFVPGADGEHILLFGTPNGRFGPARLARVPADALLDQDAWRYWTGDEWVPQAHRAAPVIPAPVAELSVLRHQPSGRWLALTLDEHLAAIVLRSAEAPTGPWSPPLPVVYGTDYPGLYGGHLLPCSATDEQLYFTMSQWGPYNVRLMRTRLAF
jgi:hypothetical protein